jgi:molecular chaperone DnaJ
MSDLYQILGIERNSDDETIKKAYKKLAIQLHPDKNKASDAEDKFKQVQNAYSILSDPEKRQIYNRDGLEGLNNIGSGPTNFPFPDIFQSFFGRDNFFGGNNFNPFNDMRNNGRIQKKDIHIKIPLTYEEIYLGCSKTVKINYLKKCIKCDGGGGSKRKCEECKGSGTIRTMKRMGIAVIANVIPCNKCSGTGEIILIKCMTCNGKCNLEMTKDLIVEIPAGIKQEHIIMKENGGHEMKDTVSDLKLSIEELPHSFYKRETNDLKCKIHISLLEALIGYEREFTLLDGRKIKYETREITKPRTKLYLRGYGMPNINKTDTNGDLICNVSIDFPNKLEDKWIEELILNRNKKNNITSDFEVVVD